MFTFISKGVNKTHRFALKNAIKKMNEKVASGRKFSFKYDENVIVIVGTKNIISQIFMSIFSQSTIVLYFTGFGRLYTDFSIFGRFFLMTLVVLSSIRKNRYFIVENSFDFRAIANFSSRSITQVNGSGFNKSLYKKRKRKRKIQSQSNTSKSDIKVLGYMSRFGNSKCSNEIVKLIKKLPPNHIIKIAGQDIYGKHYSNIFYKIAEENPKVEMLGFLESPNEITEFFNNIDIFLYPSKREGLPITLIESIYHQVPFLTTNVAGCIDLSNRFNFPTLAPGKFGDPDKLNGSERWGSWKPSWDKILNEYTSLHVQLQFELLFEKILKDIKKRI
jgi:glycosyltransferase involved in cell wall biosynthesis